MRVIKPARINEFAKKYPETKSALEAWYKLIKNNHYESFNQLRLTFPSADLVGKCVVFNIGGNKVRYVLSVPHSDTEYQRMVVLLDELLNKVDDDETHPLAGLLETLSTLIEVYEEEHHKVADAPASEVLRFLMEEHGLTANELPEIGTQEEVLNTLSGHHPLNRDKIQNLSRRFHVSPTVFL